MKRPKLGLSLCAGMLAGFAWAGASLAAPPPAPYTAAFVRCKALAHDDAALHGCLADEYGRQDRRLNAAYRALMSRLSGPSRQGLRREERAWLADTERRCRRPGPDLEGSAAPLAIDGCFLEATRQRTGDLLRHP